MKLGDKQIGNPQIIYKNTKAIIETLIGVESGAVAYATDNPTAPFGIYNGSSWTWGLFVTNGDSHDHNGGDGGAVAYSSLSGRPIAETNANDLFRCDNPGGVSLWTGTISGTPSGASVTVSAPTSGTEAVLVPTSTSQLAKMRLYNLTRGNSALILNYNTGTNVVTLTANAPANWANTDSLTIVSSTVSGGGLNWIDLEITSGPVNKAYLFVFLSVVPGAAGDTARLHPTETFGNGKILPANGQVAGVANAITPLIKITSNVVSMCWTGTPTAIVFRESGYLE